MIILPLAYTHHKHKHAWFAYIQTAYLHVGREEESEKAIPAQAIFSVCGFWSEEPRECHESHQPSSSLTENIP